MTVSRLLRAFDVFAKVGDFIMAKAGAFFLLMIIVVITAGVIMRYVLNSPLAWTEELAQMLFVWISFLGAALATARKKHIVVDMFITRWPDARRRRVAIITNILILAFLYVIIVGGYKLEVMMYNQGHVSADLDMPKTWYYFPVLLAGFYMFVLHLGDIIRLALNLPERPVTVAD